jgi:hypothetical protein
MAPTWHSSSSTAPPTTSTRFSEVEKPAGLPVERPVINLKAAKALGLVMPWSLRLGADEAIE